ncbi:MAG: DNA polymerase IV [Clostridia bacterium]|nr:DNA polymerase IV [Clostridia bacterium]
MIILHIDVNSAFLSWSALKMLSEGSTIDLRDIASAVAGDPTKRHGVILAKSISAKKYLINTGEPIFSALKKCPKLVIVKPDFTLYENFHSKFIKFLQNYFENIQICSIDECCIDYTPYINLYGDPIKFSNMIKNKIYSTLGFTVNIGIGENKLLAKMASDFSKPDKVHTIFKSQIQNKLWPLPINKLFMLGKKSEMKLAQRGFKYIKDIALSDPKILKNLLGKMGLMLWEYSNGIDNSKITTSHTLKSVSVSETIPYDINSKTDAYKQILKLSENIGERIRNLKSNTQLLCVEIKNNSFEKYSHQRKLNLPISSDIHIYEICKGIFNSMWHNDPIRSIGISANLISENEIEQLNFFDTEKSYLKHEKVDKTVDLIRKKYSNVTIKRASLL